MSFLHPEFLYYMLPPLAILFALLLTQKEVQSSFFSQEMIEKLRVTANTLSLRARTLLFLIIGLLLVFALGGPVIKDGKVDVEAKSADIILALDISKSMLARDLYPNRLKLAKEKALEFLHLAPNERIGVIAFAQNSYLVSPLSFDHDAVGFLLKNLNTDSITQQGTDFLSMLKVVNRTIKDEKHRYVLLFSDGGDSKDFSREIAYAKANHITLFIIGIATTKGAPVKLANGKFIEQNGSIIITKLNNAMAKVATQSGGVYIKGVNSNEDVKAMLKEIESTAEKKELKSKKIEKFIPLFYYPVGLALLLLLIATSSLSERKKVDLPAMFLLAALLFHGSAAKANFFDFIELGDAKKAYKEKNYAKSAQYYDDYAKKSDIGEAYYNAGNAYYKAKNYKKALENYEKATFTSKLDRAKNFANMGNAHARLGTQKELQEAIDAYKSSLKLHEDRDVRENLEAVKRALKKKKEQKKQNKKQKNKQNQQKNKQQNKQQKQQQQNKQEQNKQEQNKNQKQKSDQNKQQNEKQKKQEQNKKKKSQEAKQKQQKREDKLKELSSSATQQKKKKVKMSDAEEKKWLKSLNQQPSSYLYMLNKPKPIKENKDEKPW